VSRPDPYDALLLCSFGGPEGADDVIPFLQRVTGGRGVPAERLREVAGHYARFGGVSPIQQQNRDLLAAIRADLAAADVDIPVYWGNRNWHPLLTDTVATMADDGVRRAAVFVTSAYPSYSGCRQYREDLADAVTAVGRRAPRFDKLRHYYNHPGFVDPQVDAVGRALSHLPDPVQNRAHLVYVTHSIPVAMNDTAGPAGGGYVRAHEEVRAVISGAVVRATGVNGRPTHLAYCSRSGPPDQPWLEPDVNELLRLLAQQGAPAVVLVPIGFVSDNMEVVHDLDVEARATADQLGLPLARAATVGVDPRFVAMVRDLLLERAAVEAGRHPVRALVGPGPVSHDVCPAGCCPNLRQPGRPACAGAEYPCLAYQETPQQDGAGA
jgi:ferrochelatase